MNHELQTDGRRWAFRDRLAKTAIIVFSLNVVALVVFLVGLWAGWFHVSLEKGAASGQLQLQVTLNSTEVTDDVQEAVEEGREVVGSLETASDTETVLGRVIENDQAEGTLTVKSNDGKHITAQINEATKIEIEGAEAALATIKPGDHVELAYSTKNGQSYAMRIERLRKAEHAVASDNP